MNTLKPIPENDVTQHFAEQLVGVADSTPVQVYYMTERPVVYEFDQLEPTKHKSTTHELVSIAVLAGWPIFSTNWNRITHLGVTIIGPPPVYVTHRGKIPQFRFN